MTEHEEELEKELAEEKKKEVSGIKLSWQQISITVVAAIIIGILSFGASNYLNLLEDVDNNNDRIEKILITIPEQPPQIVINEAVKNEVESLSEGIDEFLIDSAYDKLQQKVFLDGVKEDLIKIKFKLGIE